MDVGAARCWPDASPLFAEWERLEGRKADTSATFLGPRCLRQGVGRAFTTSSGCRRCSGCLVPRATGNPVPGWPRPVRVLHAHPVSSGHGGGIHFRAPFAPVRALRRSLGDRRHARAADAVDKPRPHVPPAGMAYRMGRPAAARQRRFPRRPVPLRCSEFAAQPAPHAHRLPRGGPVDRHPCRSGRPGDRPVLLVEILRRARIVERSGADAGA